MSAGRLGGLIGIIANDSARYSLFASCITALQEQIAGRGIGKVEWLIGGDWCGARNLLAEMTLSEGYDWLWFMDDDHAFAPELLEALIAWDLPLVVPVCLTRRAPFMPVTYVTKSGENRYLPLPLSNGYPEEGLVKLEAGGCAGMLIRRDVIEAIDPPWFEYTDRSEDIVFCEKAKAAGFEIHCDLAARIGHITTAVIWPAIVPKADGTMPGNWAVGINVGNDMNLFAEFPTEEAPA